MLLVYNLKVIKIIHICARIQFEANTSILFDEYLNNINKTLENANGRSSCCHETQGSSYMYVHVQEQLIYMYVHVDE